MSLEKTIMDKMKAAMKAKDQGALRTLRAIKSEILKAKTAEGAGGDLSEADELKMLTKMAKQRRDSLTIFKEQGRDDLAQTEQEELSLIEEFLPEQMSEADVKSKLEAIIQKVGANSPKDMGRVMGIAIKEFAGAADGKLISKLTKELLTK